MDLSLRAGISYSFPVEKEHNALVYLFEGSAILNGQRLGQESAYVLTQGEIITIAADLEPARMLILAGKPLNEPVAQYGPFVMNTMDEVEQAIQDYRSGRLTDI